VQTRLILLLPSTHLHLGGTGILAFPSRPGE
jgi:hypothetical protein